MSKYQFFAELQRRLNSQGVETAMGDETLEVWLGGQPVCEVNRGGEIWAMAEIPDTEAAGELYRRTAREAELVHEYMTAMDAAPLLKASGLEDRYNLLLDYNGVVLAGMESKRCPQFVTWQWSYDRSYVTLGHYYGDNYTAAKEDFACRSGLVDDNRLFSNAQLTEMYLGLRQRLDDPYLNLSCEQEDVIKDTASQIEQLLPEVEHEYEQQLQEQAGPDPEMTMY